MRRILFTLFLAAAFATSLWSASAQTGQTGAGSQKPKAAAQHLSPEEVIKRFTAKESELRDVWKQYQYVQESRIEALGPANTISADFYQVSEFVFNDAGKRVQRIIKAPISSLETAGVLTQEDKNALTNLQPFALTTEDLPNYNVSYVGKEKVDELNTYTFDITPKVMSNPRELDRLKKQKVEGAYFQGRIWVDDEDMQVVKSAGKVVPEFKQRFPKFETYRENIDGRYWFPTYTYGDDTLFFDKGGSLHIRMVIKYKNYRQFSSDVRLLDTEEVKDEKPKKPGDVKNDDPKKEPDKTKPQRPRP